MFVLQLNDMRSPNVENMSPVARAETAEELIKFAEGEVAEKPYRDDNWYKQYLKDGPLEWFNPPFSSDRNIIDVGTADDWAEKARSQFEENIMILPVV
ncbi:MAG: hypothetical protein KAS32_23620 [Candidatus Peribacteraceae bacterium]|nr:hypothetical protein [Candidatus Peribacteraceae bacterium]